MKRLYGINNYLLYIRKDLLEYLGLEKSQNILPVFNRFNEVEESVFFDKNNSYGKKRKNKYSTNSNKYLLKASFDTKEEALTASNEVIFRTAKLLANDITFHISADNITRIIKNEDLNEKFKKNQEELLKDIK